MNKVALVTGASTGIGFATSIALARNGYTTFATMRDMSKSDTIMTIARKDELPLSVIQIDVNAYESIKFGVDKIFADTKRIDVLVNNAGYGLFGAVEDLNMNGIIAQFDTNFFGVIRLTKLVLPIMRNQMKGTIVNISSMVGRVGMPLNSVYVASKFALEGFSESIRYELRKFGINVILIEPGIVKSKFFNNIHKTGHEASDSPYSSLLQKRLDKFKSISENNSTSPNEVADTILKAVISEKPNFRYTVGLDAENVMNKKKTLSHEEFERWIWNSFIEGK